MKYLFLLLFFPIVLSAQSDLFFSEYIEGSSNNKALEIYNPTTNPISLTGYSIAFYSNGSINSSAPIALSGEITSYKTYVIGHSSATSGITSRSDFLVPLFFNGDDGSVLMKNGVAIDFIGKLGEDPGNFWGVAPVKTQDQTLRRKSSICMGDNNPTDIFNPSIEWLGFSVDIFDGLGTHNTDTCGNSGGGNGTNAVVNINLSQSTAIRQVGGTTSAFIILKETDSPISIGIDVQNPSTVAASLGFVQTGGDGTLNTDLSITQANFPANSSTQQSIIITPNNDGNSAEGVEMLTLSLNGTNATPTGLSQITIWIMDSDIPQKTLFNGLTGTALKDALFTAYGVCNDLIDYDESRDILYALIDRKPNLDVCGFYENHCINLPNGTDPSTFLYQNGSNDGINAEHLWPQSKGAAQEPMRSDMHHLRPTRAQVNSTRNNNPYGNISEIQTTNWYYQTQNLTLAPVSNQHLYSQFSNITSTFMPRLAARGDAARSSMYFYTMYSNVADVNYWNVIKGVLSGWHQQDPVDATEAYRHLLVASHQCNIINPFILDATLAGRLLNSPTDIEAEHQAEMVALSAYPNPFSHNTTLSLSLSAPQEVTINVYDILGRLKLEKTPQFFLDGTHQINIDASNFAAGIYWLNVETADKTYLQKIVKMD